MTWLVASKGPPVRVMTYEEWKREPPEVARLWFYAGHFYRRACEDQWGLWR